MEVAIDKASKNTKAKSGKPEELCPVRDILARISDKWSIYAITLLGQHGKLRFNELKKNAHGISQRMLTVTLRHLEQDGLVSRKIYPEVPPRVEYELTDLGSSLLQQLMTLKEWADEHMHKIIRSREEYILKNK